MKKLKIFIVINFICLLCLQNVLYGFFPSTDLSHEDIKTVACFLRTTTQGKKTSPLPEWSLENVVDTTNGTREMVWKNNNKKRFIIAYYGKKSLLTGNNDLVEATTYNLQGKIDKQAFEEENLCSLYENLKNSSSLRNIQDYECIFTGYGLGGSVATLSAARLASISKLHENQIKIINFSSLKVGDETFVKSLYEKIPLNNILHFKRHLDLDFAATKRHVGIPIEMTTIEGITDIILNVKKFSWRSLELGEVAVGVLALCNRLPFINENYWQHFYLLRFIGGLFFTMYGGYSFFTSTDIPSDSLITRSFCYMQSRIRSGTDLSEAGKIWMIMGSRS